jgi:hypothetical protein
MSNFGKTFRGLNYIDIIKKHQYPKLNAYGDNGKSSIQEEQLLYVN